jgi:hypothetical protein
MLGHTVQTAQLLKARKPNRKKTSSQSRCFKIMEDCNYLTTPQHIKLNAALKEYN